MELSENKYIQKVVGENVQLLPGDWGGYAAIGKERQDGGKQLMGSIDEPYIFSCVLPATDILELKDKCSRYGKTFISSTLIIACLEHIFFSMF